MSQSSAALFSSTASEAIVSIDGRVKRRIPNYETIILNISDKDVGPNTFNSVNDEFAGIPLLLDPIEIDERGRVSTKRHGAYVLGAIIIVTFAWSLYSVFLSPTESLTLTAEKAYQKLIGLASETSDTKKLKIITDLIVHDNDWNNSRVNALLKHWHALNENEQQQLTNQPWFQHFTYLSRQKIKQYQQINSATKFITNNEPLFELGIVLGILNDKGKIVGISSSSPKFQSLVDEIKQEIAQVETTTRKERKILNSEAALNSMLKQQLSVTQQPPKNILINENNVQQLLARYKTAYEKGDVEKLLALFGANKSITGETGTLASNFESIFENTSKRSINFYDFTWQGSKNNVTINSSYNGMLEFENRKGTQHVVAQAVIKAVEKEKHLYITSFKLLDSKVNVVSPQLELTKNTSPTQKENTPLIPDASELQDLTTQLVTAYETGDIEQFVSLFSENAKTNDRSDLTGIKKDYFELFSTTSDRQMFIQDLKWSGESNSAKGIGDLEVTLLSNNGNTTYSMNGKIQIVAQKINDKVHITHMYHLEHEK